MNGQQNQNCFAVIVSPSGGLPSVININGQEHWERMQMKYEVLETGTKKHCFSYYEEMMSQLVDIDYFTN